MARNRIANHSVWFGYLSTFIQYFRVISEQLSLGWTCQQHKFYTWVCNLPWFMVITKYEKYWWDICSARKRISQLVQDFSQSADYFRIIYGIYLIYKKNNTWKTSTCNRLYLKTLGSLTDFAQTLHDYWCLATLERCFITLFTKEKPSECGRKHKMKIFSQK